MTYLTQTALGSHFSRSPSGKNATADAINAPMATRVAIHCRKADGLSCSLASFISLLLTGLSILTSGPAIAATGDPLPVVPKVAESFNRTVADLEARYRLGISPWPNQVFTRMHVTSGEKQLWTGGNLFGLGIQPLYTGKGKGDGMLRLHSKPLPASALPVIVAKADAAAAKLDANGKPQITAKQAANIKAVRWSSGMLASGSKVAGDMGGRPNGYYGAVMKLSPADGLWQAFYVFDWSRSVEVDVIEAVDRNPRCYYASIHAPGVPTIGKKICAAKPLAASFHEYGALIGVNEVVFYLERKEVARSPLPAVKGVPAWNWLLHVAKGGNWLEDRSYGVNNVPKPGSSSTLYALEVLAP